MIMVKIKNITAYILLFLGITIGIKTLPSVVHKILNFFNIKNTIGMDITNCQTIGYTITVNHFFYALFLFALLSLLVSLLLLFREQKLTFKYNYFNIGFFVIFLILIFQSIILLGYIFLLMLEDKLFDKHIIYNIAFAISLFTNLLFLVLYSLIWFDKTASNEAKLIVILIFCCFSTHISMEMNSFIYFYGLGDAEAGFNPNTFFDGFEYLLNKLGIGVFCIEDSSKNPCNEYLVQMQNRCDLARDAKSIPRVPYVGSSYTLKWLIRIMNVTGTLHKSNTQQKCDKAREEYWKCMDFFKSNNYIKNKFK